ncbi:MAG: enoyl-CoA hydratase/isomerase family protein [Candidatus Freyarchaeota archaeon]
MSGNTRDPKLVKIDVLNQTAIITLNKPPVNALFIDLFNEITKALDILEQDDKIRVVIITGGDRIFSAGMDLKAVGEASPEEVLNLMETGYNFFQRLEKYPKPTIAAVKGHALGGGLGLAPPRIKNRLPPPVGSNKPLPPNSQQRTRTRPPTNRKKHNSTGSTQNKPRENSCPRRESDGRSAETRRPNNKQHPTLRSQSHKNSPVRGLPGNLTKKSLRHRKQKRIRDTDTNRPQIVAQRIPQQKIAHEQCTLIETVYRFSPTPAVGNPP